MTASFIKVIVFYEMLLFTSNKPHHASLPTIGGDVSAKNTKEQKPEVHYDRASHRNSVFGARSMILQ